MALGILVGLTRMYRRKRASSLDILTSKTGPRDFYKGKNCKPTGFHTRKGGYVVVPEKLPNYVVPDLTDFKISVKKDWAVWLQNMNLMSLSYNVGVVRTGLELKPYVSQCATEIRATDTAAAPAS